MSFAYRSAGGSSIISGLKLPTAMINLPLILPFGFVNIVSSNSGFSDGVAQIIISEERNWAFDSLECSA